MTPIWMIPDGRSIYERRDEALQEYLRAEYGSPDDGWVKAELKRPQGADGGRRFGGRVWSLLAAVLSHGRRGR